ncbi:hypothetical protein FJT64_015795 [Amphibalanus amphitrite]|uniref:Acid-sensing ion channel 3 n=1 Tax=Amphibalanus amphitrite TaxID=1232801 RepID=A0A6A4X1U7_AMPAM|nr:hypothetical protein FJT64_015795 [Amphibalanus amphitrite]
MRPSWWPAEWPGPARCLLVAVCVVLVARHCWSLLLTLLSEPTTMTITYTDRSDVQVPSITICRQSAKAFELESSNETADGANVSVAKTVWDSSLKLKDLVISCEPDCTVQEDVSFPEGQVNVGIGTWTTWVHLDSLCHIFMPNITWRGVTVLTHGQKNRDLSLTLSNSDGSVSTFVTIHPRRWPVFGGTGIEDDESFIVDIGTNGKFFAKSIVREFENLNREPCQASPDYHQEECMYKCHERIWISRYNCSLPQMIEYYPQLSECPPAYLNLTINMLGMMETCGCPKACHFRMLSVDVVRRRFPGELMNITSIYLTSARVPEEVSTFRKSYYFGDMVSDAGGFISLMLGFTVLSLFDTVNSLLQGRGGVKAGRETGPIRPEVKVITSGVLTAGAPQSQWRYYQSRP